MISQWLPSRNFLGPDGWAGNFLGPSERNPDTKLPLAPTVVVTQTSVNTDTHLAAAVFAMADMASKYGSTSGSEDVDAGNAAASDSDNNNSVMSSRCSHNSSHSSNASADPMWAIQETEASIAVARDGGQGLSRPDGGDALLTGRLYFSGAARTRAELATTKAHVAAGLLVTRPATTVVATASTTSVAPTMLVAQNLKAAPTLAMGVKVVPPLALSFDSDDDDPFATPTKKRRASTAASPFPSPGLPVVREEIVFVDPHAEREHAWRVLCR